VYLFETKRRELLGKQLAEISRDLAGAASSSPRRRTWRTANSPAFLPRSGLGPPSWRFPESTQQHLLRQIMKLAQAIGGVR